MTIGKLLSVIVVGAGLSLLGACGADDDDGGAGMTALNPIGGGGGTSGATAGMSGIGAAGVGTSGIGGIAGSSGAGAGAGGTGGAMGGMGGSAAGMGGTGMPPGNGAVAMLMGVGGQTLTGTATFTPAGMNISLVIALTQCTNGIYPVHIHAGTSCDSPGEHWDGTRGEGIPAIVCDSNLGMQTHMRMDAVAEKKWTIGTSGMDDVIGKVVVLHGASAPIACGVIKAQ